VRSSHKQQSGLRIVPDLTLHQGLTEDRKKVGQNLKTVASSEHDLDSRLALENQRIPPHHKMPNFRLSDDQTQKKPSLPNLAVALTVSIPKNKPGKGRHGKTYSRRAAPRCRPSAKATRCRAETFAAKTTARRETDNYDYPRALGP